MNGSRIKKVSVLCDKILERKKRIMNMECRTLNVDLKYPPTPLRSTLRALRKIYKQEGCLYH